MSFAFARSVSIVAQKRICWAPKKNKNVSVSNVCVQTSFNSVSPRALKTLLETKGKRDFPWLEQT
jgi:hypothetical protein